MQMDVNLMDPSVSHTYPRKTMAVISWLTPTSKTQTKEKIIIIKNFERYFHKCSGKMFLNIGSIFNIKRSKFHTSFK